MNGGREADDTPLDHRDADVMGRLREKPGCERPVDCKVEYVFRKVLESIDVCRGEKSDFHIHFSHHRQPPENAGETIQFLPSLRRY